MTIRNGRETCAGCTDMRVSSIEGSSDDNCLFNASTAPEVATAFRSPGFVALPTPTVISAMPALLAFVAAFRAAVPGFFLGL